MPLPEWPRTVRWAAAPSPPSPQNFLETKRLRPIRAHSPCTDVYDRHSGAWNDGRLLPRSWPRRVDDLSSGAPLDPRKLPFQGLPLRKCLGLLGNGAGLATHIHQLTHRKHLDRCGPNHLSLGSALGRHIARLEQCIHISETLSQCLGALRHGERYSVRQLFAGAAGPGPTTLVDAGTCGRVRAAPPGGLAKPPRRPPPLRSRGARAGVVVVVVVVRAR